MLATGNNWRRACARSVVGDGSLAIRFSKAPSPKRDRATSATIESERVRPFLKLIARLGRNRRAALQSQPEETGLRLTVIEVDDLMSAFLKAQTT